MTVILKNNKFLFLWKKFKLPKKISKKRVGFFLGSSIGNFYNKKEKIFLQNARTTLGKNGCLFVGVDLIKNKTIILTGAMIPYKFGSSDGLFNLGSALSFLQSKPFGIYIAMNGNIFEWNNVKKNKVLGLFETLNKWVIYSA